MTDLSIDGAVVKTARQEYRRTRRKESIRALVLALPLLVFLLATFIIPIGSLLMRSVLNNEVPEALPHLTQVLRDWNGQAPVPPEAYQSLATDLTAVAHSPAVLGKAARRMNFYRAEFRSLLFKTSRKVPPTSTDWRQAFIDIDPRWEDISIWQLMKRGAVSPTPDYLLTAMDAKADPAGDIHALPADQSIYISAYVRTFLISLSVTLISLVLGYPVAWLLANLPERQSRRMMLLVIIPFWTSLLVRTSAWYVLLQPNGVVNSVLASAGLISQPLALVFNRTGVLIGMTHIMVPFMILAIYSVMKGISPVYMRAARSLGAGPVTAFLRVYVPQSLPGVGAGCFLVFIVSLGYYITPALLGGAGDEMVSQLIALQTNVQLNWGLAGALSLYLVAFTLFFYFVFNRLVGIDRLRFG